MPNDLFNGQDQTKEEKIESYLNHLVGDGKKFKDVEALARGKHEADLHAKRLEEELAKLNLEYAKTKSVEEFVNQMLSKTGEKTAQPNSESNQEPPVQKPVGEVNKASLSLEDIEKLMNEKLQKATLSQRKQENVSKVHETLKDKWGDGYKSVLKDKVKVLGATEEFLATMAEDYPDAFIALVAGDARSTPPPSAPKSSVNSSFPTGNSSNQKNFAYYEKMRKTDPKSYWKSDVQMEMHRNATALGDAFFQK